MSNHNVGTDLPNSMRDNPAATGWRQVVLERHARITHLVFVSADEQRRVGPAPADLEAAALFLAGQSGDVGEARDVLETCGLIKPERAR